MPCTNFILLLLALICCMGAFAQRQPNTPPPSTSTATPVKPQVTITRSYVPLDCRIAVTSESSVTFHYVAHLVTPQRTVGDIFDETADYEPITLRANPRTMLAPLAAAMQGACVDERRTVVIPHSFATFDSLPKNTDIVFFVHVIAIEPWSDNFELIDTDHDNCITKDELIAYIKSTGRVAENLIPTTAVRMLRQNDRNQDGVIVCSEFSFQYGECDLHKDAKCLTVTTAEDGFNSFFNNFAAEHDDGIF